MLIIYSYIDWIYRLNGFQKRKHKQHKNRHKITHKNTHKNKIYLSPTPMNMVVKVKKFDELWKMWKFKMEYFFSCVWTLNTPLQTKLRNALWVSLRFESNYVWRPLRSEPTTLATPQRRPIGLEVKSPIVDWLRGAHACMDLATSWRPFGPFHLTGLEPSFTWRQLIFSPMMTLFFCNYQATMCLMKHCKYTNTLIDVPSIRCIILGSNVRAAHVGCVRFVDSFMRLEYGNV